ncbi:MAG: hypothetical protein Q9217_001063 [Psora testacea]
MHQSTSSNQTAGVTKRQSHGPSLSDTGCPRSAGTPKALCNRLSTQIKEISGTKKTLKELNTIDYGGEAEADFTRPRPEEWNWNHGAFWGNDSGVAITGGGDGAVTEQDKNQERSQGVDCTSGEVANEGESRDDGVVAQGGKARDVAAAGIKEEGVNVADEQTVQIGDAVAVTESHAPPEEAYDADDDATATCTTTTTHEYDDDGQEDQLPLVHTFTFEKIASNSGMETYVAFRITSHEGNEATIKATESTTIAKNDTNEQQQQATVPAMAKVRRLPMRSSEGLVQPQPRLEDLPKPLRPLANPPYPQPTRVDQASYPTYGTGTRAQAHATATQGWRSGNGIPTAWTDVRCVQDWSSGFKDRTCNPSLCERYCKGLAFSNMKCAKREFVVLNQRSMNGLRKQPTSIKLSPEQERIFFKKAKNILRTWGWDTEFSEDVLRSLDRTFETCCGERAEEWKQLKSKCARRSWMQRGMSKKIGVRINRVCVGDRVWEAIDRHVAKKSMKSSEKQSTKETTKAHRAQQEGRSGN